MTNRIPSNIPGFFLVLEGIDGTGKTTIASMIEKFFLEQGIDIVRTREPGGTPSAEALRELVLWGTGRYNDDWCRMAETLIYLASRVQHTEVLIKPSLQLGKLVFCERYCDSTYAHQGGGRKIDVPTLKQLHALTIGNFKPDLIILLDGDPEVLRHRIIGRSPLDSLDRMEQEGLEFQQRSRQIHLDQAREDPGRYLLVNVERPIEEVFAEIEQTLLGVMKHRFKKTV